MTEPRPGRLSPTMLFTLLGVALVVSILLALGLGAVDISPGSVVGIVLDHLGIDSGISYSDTQDAVLWSIRLPRVVLGLLVGAGLGVAGAAFQGIFRNPLADPQLIGVSSGAAVGTVVLVLALESLIGDAAAPFGGVVGATIAVTLVYRSARHQGRTEVVTLVLAGFAIAAVGTATAGFVAVAADDPRLGSVLFYTLGSLAIATWHVVAVTAPFVLVAVVILPLFARRLDIMLLGEREAAHLGVDVDRLRLFVVAAGVVAVGPCVAATGVIGFVGLVVPHGVRLLVGPGHRHLFAASALGGATFVVLADLVARTVASPLEMPVGLLTAVVGGPVFLLLLRRTRREHGGWG